MRLRYKLYLLTILLPVLLTATVLLAGVYWLVGLAVPADVLTRGHNYYLLSVGLLAATLLAGNLALAYKLSRRLIRRLDQSLVCVRGWPTAISARAFR